MKNTDVNIRYLTKFPIALVDKLRNCKFSNKLFTCMNHIIWSGLSSATKIGLLFAFFEYASCLSPEPELDSIFTHKLQLIKTLSTNTVHANATDVIA